MSRNLLQEPLIEIPVGDWISLEAEFKKDWTRGIPGYYLLVTQRKWVELGFYYGLKVFCPHGDVTNGLVALNVKDTFYEVIIQCPNNDTKILEEALIKTKLVDWKTPTIIVPFAHNHVIECLKRVLPQVNAEIDHILPSNSFVYYNHRPKFEDIELPNNIKMDFLTLEHVELVNSVWPHRYPNSICYFTQLVNAKSGFGIFKNGELVSWVFIIEVGTLGHLYTLEEYRKQGYAELLLKLMMNIMLEEKKDIFGFSVKTNEKSYALFKKIGFENFDSVSWCYIKPTKIQQTNK